MNDFCLHDNILLPVTFDDLVLMAQNINPASGRTLRGELHQLLQERVEDAMECFDEHEQDIYEAACPDGHRELERAPGWTAERCEQLAQEIYQWLLSLEMWVDVCIYYNGKRMTTHGEVDGKSVYRYNGEPFIEEDKDPRDYFEYVANPHILSMSFEGIFYEVMNGYHSGKWYEEFCHLLEKHGLYFELGNAWNLTVAEVI